MNTPHDVLTVDQIVSAQLGVIRSSLGPSAIFLVGIAGLASAFDILGWADESSVVLALSIASLIASFCLMLRMLQCAELLPEGTSKGFGSYFGLGLVSGLGIGLGLVLLIIPGVVLFVRWTLAYAVLFVDEEDVSETLTISWNATRPHIWPLAVVSVLSVLPIFAGLLLYAFAESWTGWFWHAGLIAANILIYLN